MYEMFEVKFACSPVAGKVDEKATQLHAIASLKVTDVLYI
jgi:hypothetical protein